MLNLKHTCLVVVFAVMAMPAVAQKASEYQVKAAFLFNFSKFLNGLRLRWDQAANHL